jgi:hypothetical protein
LQLADCGYMNVVWYRSISLTRHSCSNLVMANRMIFLEPVWQKDVEAQAQKVTSAKCTSDNADDADIWNDILQRIHRIGQKRVTTSHTLYLKGTFEEARLMRRDETDKQNEYDDAEMHNLIRVSLHVLSPPQPPLSPPASVPKIL